MTTKITEQNISNLANAGVDWQAVFTGDGSTGLTAVAGRGYFIDTTSGTVTVTLPASPSAGDTIAIIDYAGTFNTNNVTLNRNGNNIKGSATNETISTNNGAYSYVYIDGTQGWKNYITTDDLPTFISATGGTVTTSGDYKLHTFTGDGTFCVSDNGNQTQAVTITVVGGGAGGGNRHGGGGGAGGITVGQSVPVTAQGYPITVGAGGNGSSAPTNRSCAGSNSSGVSFVGIGGGPAGSQGPIPSGLPGGSGGGAAVGGVGPAGPNPGGSATQPGQPQPAASVFNAGSAGGAGGENPGPDDGGGGGGGATSAGIPSNPSNPNFSDGGAGKDISPFVNIAPIYPNSAIYAGGGGGGANNNPEGGTGGVGGGGPGGPSGTAGTAGTANTGGGGGASGSACTSGGAGGKGIVLIEYKYK